MHFMMLFRLAVFLYHCANFIALFQALFFADQLLSQASMTQQQSIIKDFKAKDQMSKRAAISKVF